jgi:hypothetical protein
VNDPTRDPPSSKFGGEARAGQTSTSTGGSAGAREGTMSPDYEGTGDGFLGPDAHVVSGEPRTGDLGGDQRGGPAMVIDPGRNPNPSAGGDDLVRSHGQDDDSVRTAEESRSTDDEHP